MRKVMMMLTVLLLLLGLAGSASANTVIDTTTFTDGGTVDPGDLDDSGWGAVRWISGTGDFVAWTHHYSFVPPAQTIVSGKIAIIFYDNETDGSGFLSREYALGWGEDWTVDFGEISAGEKTYSLNIDKLADGTYSVIVGSIFGDFGITSAVLTIEYNPQNGNNSHPVPEPSTLLLLGSGLLGIVAFGRKRAK